MRSPVAKFPPWASTRSAANSTAIADASRPTLLYHGYSYWILTKQETDKQGGARNYLAKEHVIGEFAVIALSSEP